MKRFAALLCAVCVFAGTLGFEAFASEGGSVILSPCAMAKIKENDVNATKRRFITALI